MAQRFTTIYECDMDGKEITDPETIKFSINGVSYEIELCREHAEEFRSFMSTYTVSARRSTARRLTPSGRPARTNMSREKNREVRVWAKERGLTRADGAEMAERGRIPGEILAAYDEWVDAGRPPLAQPQEEAKPGRRRKARSADEPAAPNMVPAS